MADALYPLGKKKLLDGDIDLLADDIVAILIDTADETYNAADEFVDDLAGAGVIATSGPLTGKDTTGGLFSADNIDIPGVTGDTVEAVVLAMDTGSDATSPLIAWFDVSTYTPSGVDATLAWHASGIFAI